MRLNNSRSSLRVMALAGLAGGVAEIVWIAAYCTLAPLAGREVLRDIAATVLPATAASPFAPVLGMAIHLGLAVFVAIAFGHIVWRRYARSRGTMTVLVASVLLLAAIWSFNFFVLLPALNPAFATLMPYEVTLVSKLLFGLAMGTSFARLSQIREIGRGEEIAAQS